MPRHDHWLSADEARERDLLAAAANDAFAGALAPAETAQLGWTGLLTDEDARGQGWYPGAAGVVATECGAALHPSAWAGAALAAGLLSGDRASLAGSWRDDALRGGVGVGFGIARGRPDSAGCWTGTARVLSEGGPERMVIVAADGTAAWAIERSAALQLRPVELDTTRTVTALRADDAPTVPLDPLNAHRIVAAAALLLAADAVGALRSTLELVTGHLVDRQAFGAPLASLQVLQHRIVDHDVVRTAAQSVVSRALRDLERTGTPDGGTWAAARYVHGRVTDALDDCIQLAGGIGFTWEYPVHHALRRATVAASLSPDPMHVVDRLAAAGGW